MGDGTIDVAVFGASGIAGEGVLAACLADPKVGRIVAPTRRALAVTDPRVEPRTITDFTDEAALAAALAGVDAVFYCLGISVAQAGSDAEYRRITYDFALAAARATARANPRATFHFVSGGGTDPQSRMMWARVKGETETALQSVVSGGVVCWRPGFIVAPRSPRGLGWAYRLLRGLVGVVRWIAPAIAIRAQDIGVAMLHAQRTGVRSGILENREMRALAAAASPIV